MAVALRLCALSVATRPRSNALPSSGLSGYLGQGCPVNSEVKLSFGVMPARI